MWLDLLEREVSDLADQIVESDGVTRPVALHQIRETCRKLLTEYQN